MFMRGRGKRHSSHQGEGQKKGRSTILEHCCLKKEEKGKEKYLSVDDPPFSFPSNNNNTQFLVESSLWPKYKIQASILAYI